MNRKAVPNLHATNVEGAQLNSSPLAESVEHASNAISVESEQAYRRLHEIFRELRPLVATIATVLQAARPDLQISTLNVGLCAGTSEMLSQAVAHSNAAAKSQESNADLVRSAAASPLMASSQESDSNSQVTKRKALLAEMKHVADLLKAGLDPDVKMDFIVTYVGESRANLYKKMGSAFPSPKKRGRGSFWLMSQIDAYKEANHD